MVQSTTGHGNAGRPEFRYAAVFKGSNLKRFLVEVHDLAFDSSSCRAVGLDVTFAEEVVQVTEIQTRYLTVLLN